MKRVLLIAAFSIVAFSAQSAEITPTCKVYFEKIGQFLGEVAKNSATRSQIEPIKQQLVASKQQIVSLPKDVQEQSCSQGLEALKQMEATLSK